MNSLRDKRFYKVISLFIKAVILTAAFWYILLKLNSDGRILLSSDIFLQFGYTRLFLLFLLMLMNWGLEALKWKLLISSLEEISFAKSFGSVLAGVTVGIFTPNRVGEFTGRVFALATADKLKATFLSFIGSGLQLLVTIAAGITGYYILQDKYHGFFDNTSFGWNRILPGGIIGILVLVLIVVLLWLSRHRLKNRFANFFLASGSFPIARFGSVFLLSLLRYAVFSVQYYIALRMFGVNAGSTILFCLIFLTFFMTSAIPTFAMTEIAVRSASAIFFFGMVCDNTPAIIASSLLLWIINLAIPAVAGTFFIWRLKFFSE